MTAPAPEDRPCATGRHAPSPPWRRSPRPWAARPPSGARAGPGAAPPPSCSSRSTSRAAGFNKAVEIFNGTGAPVDLAAGGYTLELYSNGAAAPSQSVALTGTVADGDVFVVSAGRRRPGHRGPGRPARPGRRQLERRRRRRAAQGRRAPCRRRSARSASTPAPSGAPAPTSTADNTHPPQADGRGRRHQRRRRLRPGRRVGRASRSTPSTASAATRSGGGPATQPVTVDLRRAR